MVAFALIIYFTVFLLIINKKNNKSNSIDRVLQIKEYELIRDVINDSKK
jgi:hypothetical protein